MKIFNVKAEINGSIIFEIKANSRVEAERQVAKLLENTSLKEAISKYQDTLYMNTSYKEKKCLER